MRPNKSPHHTYSDSAGQPWAGRTFDSNPFARDDGSAPAEFLDAIHHFHSMRTFPRGHAPRPLPDDSVTSRRGRPWSHTTAQAKRWFTDERPSRRNPPPASASSYDHHEAAAGQAEQAVVDVLRTTRLLIPLLTHRGETTSTVDADHSYSAGLTVDTRQELSVVTVAARDGRRVLPVFSSVAAMSRWNAHARPVPSDGMRVALAAAGDATDRVVVDPTSLTEFAIRRPALWAIAQSGPWRPSYVDRDVARAVTRSVEKIPGVHGVTIVSGDPWARLEGPEVLIRVELVRGLSGTQLDALLRTMRSGWAASDVIASRVDSLGVNIVAQSSFD